VTWSCLIATCGDEAWSELAWKRAYPSAMSQGFDEVIVEHHADATLAQARNRILASADCDVVVFLDADDELEPGYLDAMKRALEIVGDHVVLLAPAVRYAHAGGRLENARIVNRGRWPRLNECVIGTAAPRRRLLEIGGFDEWEAWDDWVLWLKCVAKGARIVYVEEAVYRAHVSPTSRHRSLRNGATLHARITAAHREWAAREGVPSLL